MFVRAVSVVMLACVASPLVWAVDVSGEESGQSTTRQVSSGEELGMAPGSAELLKVGRSVGTIIIGNPDIVDASVINESTVAVTAKTAGTTNMILLDAQQAEILRTIVQVGPRPRQVQVLSGDRSQAYACTPRCNPDPQAVLPYAETTATTVVRNPDGTEASTVSGTTRANPRSASPRTNAPPAQPQ
jgi:hypothetical protein